VERAVAAIGSTLTEFAEASLRQVAQRTLADRTVFDLSPDAVEAWDTVNARRARDLPDLRDLLSRPTPFAD
jgi:uncharacterized protein (DUF1778 family)